MLRWANGLLQHGNRRLAVYVISACFALVAVAGVGIYFSFTHGFQNTRNHVALSHESSQVVTSGNETGVLGTSTNTQPNGSSQPLAQGQSTSKNGANHKGLGFSAGNTGGSSASTPVVAHLMMSPNVIVEQNVYEPRPYIHMSNEIEISQPTTNELPDFVLSWFDDGRGHYAPGDYYLGWIPFLLPKHPITQDMNLTYTATVQDRAGNSYSTTFTIIWMVPRNLGLSIGTVNKQVVGANTVYTAQLLFNPTSNVGNPVIHVFAGGFYNFGPDTCNVSETDVTFTYAGQSSMEVSCTVSTDKLSSYQGGFDVYVNAHTQWPPLSPEGFVASFHAS